MTANDLHVLIFGDHLGSAEYAAHLRRLGFRGPLTAADTAAEALAALPTADVFVGDSSGLPPGALRDAGQVRLIHSVYAGVEGWFRLEPPEHVPLVKMTRIFDVPIAEFVLGHLLAQHLGIARLRQQQQERRWERFPTQSLYGKTMGIAGAGEIGLAIANRASAFGMHVLGLVRSPRPAAPPIDGYFTLERLDEFLSELDVLVMVLPKTPETHHLFGERAFARLRPGAWVVNVGRGHCVNEAALAAAVRSGHLGGAILDVYQTEPLPQDNPLWDLPNVVLSPHMSGMTVPAAAAAVIWGNLQRLAAGQPLVGLVDRRRGY